MALVALLALLAVLDIVRAQAGVALAPWQWGVGLITLFALWRQLRARRVAPLWPILALAALLLPSWVHHTRVIGSDGLHYYSYLRSALFDHDLNLANDQELLQTWERGWPNVFPVGPALLWAPFVLLVHVAWQLGRLFGAAPPDGTESAYQAAVCLGTLSYGSAALFLLYDTLRRWTGPAAAFWTTLLCWLASPLRFYLSVQPSLAHAVEFFATVLVMRTARALREDPADRSALLAGATCGLAFLVRYQSGLLLLLPGLPLVACLFRPASRSLALRRLALVVAAFVVVALPQALVWQSQFGVPLLVPQQAGSGGRFMSATQPHLVDTLLSARGGLFVSYPLALVGGLGLFGLARRDALYVASALGIVLGTWYVNSLIFDWFQVRRFTLLFPLLAPGIALLMAPLARLGPLLPALAVLLGWRYDLAVRTLSPLREGSVPVRAALSELSDGVVEASFAGLEPLAPRVAVRLLGAYTGEALLENSVSYVELGQAPSLLRLPRRQDSLSEVEVEEGVACRWIRGKQVRFLLPMAVDNGVVVMLHARALESEQPQAMEGLWNGVSLGRKEMVAHWSDYRFDVPAEALRPGSNELELRFDRAPQYRHSRGDGPREFRSAALASITLHRR